MSDEFILSLRHSLHHVYSVARTLPRYTLFPGDTCPAIFPLTGCGDKHENTPPRAGGTPVWWVQRKRCQHWKEPVRSMPMMRRR